MNPVAFALLSVHGGALVVLALMAFGAVVGVTLTYTGTNLGALC